MGSNENMALCVIHVTLTAGVFMDILRNIVTSKLWICGNNKIVFGSHDCWQFFYSIEGTNIKHWTILFYNNVLNKIYVRSPIIDIKAKDIFVRSTSFISNIYKLVIENTNRDGKFELWSVDERHMIQPHLLHSKLPGGSRRETYFCNPAIRYTDQNELNKVAQTNENALLDVPEDAKSTTSVCGYTCYKHVYRSHSDHYRRTWIPTITVDCFTFDCSFHIHCSNHRQPKECLQCVWCEVGSTLSPRLSNLIVNH